MPSTRKQKAKARRSKEQSMLSDIENVNKMQGGPNLNSLERQVANSLNGSVGPNDGPNSSPEKILTCCQKK